MQVPLELVVAVVVAEVSASEATDAVDSVDSVEADEVVEAASDAADDAVTGVAVVGVGVAVVGVGVFLVCLLLPSTQVGEDARARMSVASTRTCLSLRQVAIVMLDCKLGTAELECAWHQGSPSFVPCLILRIAWFPRTKARSNKDRAVSDCEPR